MMVLSAAPMPLMRNSLSQANHSPTQDEISACLPDLQIELSPSNDQIADMFLALAKHFCSEGEDVQNEAEMYEKTCSARDDTDAELLADPLLEAVYDDMEV